MTAAIPTSRAFGVWFRHFRRWDPASYERICWHWPPAVLQPIASVLTPRREKVDRKRFTFNELRPITIHFDGSIDPRKMDGNREYTMELFFARPGDVVVAKIDLKNGAVAVVPDGWDNVAVTGHFAVYQLDRARVLPEYFCRVIQSSFFKAHLWRNKVGAEGRKEVKLGVFEASRIPMPALCVQRGILAAWERAQRELVATRAKIAALEERIEADFLADLGLKAPPQATLPKCFAVRWKNFWRWGVQPNQLAAVSIDVTRGRYPTARAFECLTEVKHGCSASPSPKRTGLDVLKISAVTRGEFRPEERKFAYDRPRFRREFDLKAGDVLMCRTNGTLGLVGMSALVERDMADLIYPDKVIRVRVRDKLLPAYFWRVVQAPFVRSQIGYAARTAVGNYAIGSDDILNLEFPLPPLEVQRRMTARVETTRTEIGALRTAAAEREQQAKADVETMILGTKPVTMV